MTDNVSEIESQSIDRVAVSASANSVSVADSVCVTASVNSVSDSDSVSIPKKRCRGKDRSKKSNERRRARQKAARDVAGRAIVRASEFQAEAREVRSEANQLRALARRERESTKREQKLRLDLAIELVKTKAELRESVQARTTAEGRARAFEAKFEIQKAVTDSTTLSVVRDKLLLLPKSDYP
jgi:hypothetical protein